MMEMEEGPDDDGGAGVPLAPPPPPPPLKIESKTEQGGGGSGWGVWGGWRTSAFSVLSELQKAATEAAEEISKNAVAAANVAAKGVSDLQSSVVDAVHTDAGHDDGPKEEVKEEVTDTSEGISQEESLRRAALEKLEGASEDSFLGQGLKVLDDSVENLTTGAWQALGNAWKGSIDLVHKLENTTLHQGGTLAPSLIQSSRELTAKGIRVLEKVGRETLDMLAAETGFELEKDEVHSEMEVAGEGDSFTEDVTFDRCFYVYGGPEHLEELEALSNHYTLLCNRARGKLSGEQRAEFEALLKQLQQLFTFSGESDASSPDAGKGKKVAQATNTGSEIKALRDSSVSKAAEMATGFSVALGGLAMTEVVQKTTDRLNAIKAEGVHERLQRLSELCALCIAHLLQLGKSVLTTTTEESEKTEEGLDWPTDCIGKAHIIRAQTQALTGDIEVISESYITGIGDVIAAFQAAIKSEELTVKDGEEEDVKQGLLQEGSIEDTAQAVNSDLEEVASIAIEKVRDGLNFLLFVVLSTSLKT